jgi:hypothetical protein
MDYSASSVAAGTCVNFVASRCLKMDHSGFQVSCHNITGVQVWLTTWPGYWSLSFYPLPSSGKLRVISGGVTKMETSSFMNMFRRISCRTVLNNLVLRQTSVRSPTESYAKCMDLWSVANGTGGVTGESSTLSSAPRVAAASVRRGPV